MKGFMIFLLKCAAGAIAIGLVFLVWAMYEYKIKAFFSRIKMFFIGLPKKWISDLWKGKDDNERD